MMKRVLLCLAVLSVGCGDDVGTVPPPQPGEVPGERGLITDQSGAVFGWVCDEERCKVENMGEPIPHCNSPSRSVYTYTGGHFVEITPACASESGEWGSLPHWARLVVCEDDTDCPVIRSRGDETLYVCDAGFCKDVEHADSFDELPNKWMMMSLCIGDNPRDLYGAEDPWGAFMTAIDAACPGDSINAPCQTIPPGCRDPRGP